MTADSVYFLSAVCNLSKHQTLFINSNLRFYLLLLVSILAMSYLFDWWMDLSPWLRAGTAITLIVISLLLWLLTSKLFIGLLGTGIALLIFSGPSDSEKNGYHF